MTKEKLRTVLDATRSKKNRRMSNEKSTDIMEISEDISDQIDSPYPFCVIPRHYFDRQLALASRPARPEISVERW